MRHRKGSVARAIQDYFLSKVAEDMGKNPDDGSWFWLPIPNNPEFCVALEWQGTYDPGDKDIYGRFMDNEYVINVSIKMTDEFRINGDMAYYAEWYFLDNEDDELFGGYSLHESDVSNNYYNIAKCLANDFLRFNKMKPRRQ